MKLTFTQRQATIDRIELLEARQTRQERRRLFAFYPEAGALRRGLYAKYIALFAAGAKYRERCMMAGNRTGKTEGTGGYEVTVHLTGLYPDWWEGKRFIQPVRALVAGDTATTVRDIVQRKLCGPPQKPGTGLIPFASFGTTTAKAGVPGADDIVKVRHEPTGQLSELQFRSYDQGRISFQGTKREVVWCDEEPPKDVYDECLLRTMTTGGIVICTFTPLNGLSEVDVGSNRSGIVRKPQGRPPLLTQYGRLGLNLVAADHAVEAGIEAVSQRLSSGRLRVFRTLSAWLSEVRRYRRDNKGQEDTLLMDCTRHLVLTGMKHASIDHDTYDRD
jgi:phage terminase large subunit-like protein